MQEAATEPVEVEAPTPSLAIHELTICPCELVNGHLVVRGESQTLDLMDAVARLAPSQSRSGRINVMRAKRGDFVGLRGKDGANFVVRNPTGDGDVRWLLSKFPAFEHYFSEVWLVQDVIRRSKPTETTVDGQGMG